MSVKLTGVELSAWMADKSFWKDGYWYEDAVLSINGGDEFDWDGEPIAPDDKIAWSGGCLYLGDDTGAESRDLERELRKWLKAQTRQALVLMVDKDRFAEIKAQLLAVPGVSIASPAA